MPPASRSRRKAPFSSRRTAGCSWPPRRDPGVRPGATKPPRENATIDILIRAAGEGDFDDLCEIIAQVDELHREHLPRRFRAPDGPARSRDFILEAVESAEIGLFVAEVERSSIGFVHVVIKETPDIPIFVPRRYAVVENLAVQKGWRRAGVGRALMRKAEDWASSKEATSLELTVYAFNRPAAAFYETLGYATLSRRMVKRLE